MRQVTGFLSNDGTFYETKIEAEYEEAKNVLEGLLVSENINYDIFIEVAEKLHVQVATFIAKYDALQGLLRQRQEPDDKPFECPDCGADLAVEGHKAGCIRSSASHSDARTAEDDFDTKDLPGGEEDNAPVQHVAAGRSQHVSDMGSGERTTPVQHNGPKHGSRSGKPHAQRLRRGPNVAAKAPSGTSKAR